MSEADFKGFQRPIANSQVNAITDGSQSQMAPIHATATERIYSQSDPHSREVNLNFSCTNNNKGKLFMQTKKKSSHNLHGNVTRTKTVPPP
jgi:hypothetical protein